MRKYRLFWQLYRTNLLIALLSLLIFAGYTAGMIRALWPETMAGYDILPAIYTRMALGWLVMAFLIAAVSSHIPWQLSRQIESMWRGTERLAGGETRGRLPGSVFMEIDGWAEAVNKMAMQLEERLQTVMHQGNEREAVLSSMVEGVLVMDTGERILSMNQAASRMLDVNLDKVVGRHVQEVVRNSDLLKFAAQIPADGQNIEGDIVLYHDEKRFLQAHGVALRDAQGNKTGAMVVLNDVTRIRRLEDIRRDFVANVSHELKTPITSIKGFVETMLDSAPADKDKTERFLNIIAQQANRLNAIIEDLLSLARIEEDAEKSAINLGEFRLKRVLQAAIQTCELKAAEKDMKLELSCADDVKARINPPLLEQAAVNLINNAIKYSEPKNPVRIEVIQGGMETVINVEDRGCGIGKEHLPRIFERFYCVDKARSRKMGGTGLGLAIVKHIVAAHNGNVSVKSVPGEGSTFSIHLPLNT